MLRRWIGIGFVLAGLVLSSCGESVIAGVDDGAYRALVPTTEQFAVDNARDIPGGFTVLRDAGINEVDLRVAGDEVTFRLDGADAVTRQVLDRLELTNREGSGPFKGKTEVLVLGDDALVLGELSIAEPVIWPGTFDESPVITVKPRDPEERGLGVSCGSNESCLLLSAGVDPIGRYENVNDPQLGESPIALIEVAGDFVEFTLRTGQQVRASRADESSTPACGLSETLLWDVPAEIDLAMEDPVLIHTLCPSTPGAATQLTIMERAEIPLLAPLGSATDGEWCFPDVDCLWFLPI
jgi:hypothetical protein